MKMSVELDQLYVILEAVIVRGEDIHRVLDAHNVTFQQVMQAMDKHISELEQRQAKAWRRLIEYQQSKVQ
jgi:hypothetical protein